MYHCYFSAEPYYKQMKCKDTTERIITTKLCQQFNA